MTPSFTNTLFDFLVELLEIPKSHYERAEERYHSLSRWLHRDESKIRIFVPQICPQGSFRYGTVIRPLFRTEEYDLDLVCQLGILKQSINQKDLKFLVGEEIKSYATANSFNDPAEEKPRCWRLNYADKVSFHMDILPCVAEDQEFLGRLLRAGVPTHFAETAVAITDRRHPNYAQVAANWFSSNPRGIARWFEKQMKPIAYSRIKSLVENRAYASTDDVPTYEWKTPLQRAIQIMKRHRDVMFADSPEWKPLSMIILTLATHAYEGEPDVLAALKKVVADMPRFIRSSSPRIPNPVNPAEDFADRWSKDSRFEQNFRAWHSQMQADLGDLERLGDVAKAAAKIRRAFAVQLTQDMQDQLAAGSSEVPKSVYVAEPVLHIASAPRPWRRNG